MPLDGLSDDGFHQIEALLTAAIGAAAGREALDDLALPAALKGDHGPQVSRATFAMALNACLFNGLMARSPTAAAYVAEVRAAGGQVLLDHGALRTVSFADNPTGEQPQGHLAFARILEPLGYEVADLYPLEGLKMTGRGYRHRDLPEALPQFFVSELHVERFSPSFQAAARHVFGAIREALDTTALDALDAFTRDGACEAGLAAHALPVLAAAFSRWHAAPSLLAYEVLLAESPEAAWIATEGSAFNHATDRVADVEAVAEAKRKLGRPIKETVERSTSGRVRQTAFRADPVERAFEDDGKTVHRLVPGSFFEFISRGRLDDGALDLAFDSGNAQGIFRMTTAV